jgi:hypothetical protein
MSTRMKALLKAACRPSVAARSASALISRTVMRSTATMVVVRRPAAPTK